MTTVKQVQYSTTNRYDILNQKTSTTRYVWLVFHGMGYLSKYFIKYFDGLDSDKHYIIAPQAPSKYYQDNRYKRIGASWLTREDTQMDLANVLNFIDAIYNSENLADLKLIVLGYSQGVSIATRWLAHSKVACHQLILHSGGIPKELLPEQFEFLPEDCPVDYVYGEEDPYIHGERILQESQHAQQLFGARFRLHPFKGAHVVNRDYIMNSYKL